MPSSSTRGPATTSPRRKGSSSDAPSGARPQGDSERSRKATSLKVAVLDHGMGNLRSVAKALEAAGPAVVVTSDRSEIERCDALCVPGQGIFGRCMTNLTRSRFDEVVREWIGTERPYLGICLGMQVLFDSSEENPDVPGLGIVSGRVTRLPSTVPVPHIGWNTVARSEDPDSFEYFYFDHSFAVHPEDRGVVQGWCEHGESFAASIRTGSILGTQFHPEKSGHSGIALLKDWSES